MFIKVHQGAGDLKGDNRGSCAKLAEYLDKDQERGQQFFDHAGNDVRLSEVVDKIDHNKKGLKSTDEKFFMITVNPSEADQAAIIAKQKGYFFNTFDYDEMTSNDRAEIANCFKDYVREVMDAYAINFDRDNIKSGDDLLYYGRIEFERTYKHYDKEVLSGKARPGDPKPGLNMHAHIIVSRKSKDGNVKLSPNIKSKGNEWQLNGKQAKRGFNHERFKITCERKFYTTYDEYMPYLNDETRSRDRYSYRSSGRVEDENIKNWKRNKSVVSGAASVGNCATHTVKSTVKGKVKQNLKDAVKGGQADQFRNEKKIKRSAEDVVRLFRSPKAALISKVRMILFGVASGSESEL
jgi:hypothetical protein